MKTIYMMIVQTNLILNISLKRLPSSVYIAIMQANYNEDVNWLK